MIGEDDVDKKVAEISKLKDELFNYGFMIDEYLGDFEGIHYHLVDTNKYSLPDARSDNHDKIYKCIISSYTPDMGDPEPACACEVDMSITDCDDNPNCTNHEYKPDQYDIERAYDGLQIEEQLYQYWKLHYFNQGNNKTNNDRSDIL